MPIAEINTASFKKGYAQSASESRFPFLWKGLYGAWEFGIQEDGPRIYDLRRRWDIGTFSGAPSWDMSNVGRSLSFDGVDDYVTITDFSWPANSPVTVSMWIRVNTGDVVAGSCFGIGLNATAGARFQAHVPWNDNVVYWDYGRVELTGTSFSSQLDKWAHVALTADGVGSQQVILDGIVAQTISSSATPSAISDLSIGRAFITGSGDLFFGGRMRHFRIYNRVLTPNEIWLSYIFPEGPFIKKVDFPEVQAGEPPVDGSRLLSLMGIGR